MEFAEFIKVPMVDNVTLYRPFKVPDNGTLCITGHHMIFSTRQTENHEELWLLHSAVDAVERKMMQSNGKVSIILRCKDFKFLSLEIENAEVMNSVATSIEQLSNIDDVTLKYPFFYRAMFEPLEDGWQAFQPENDYPRFKECADEWRVTNINREYKAVMMRCSQPLTGPNNKRCKEDEKLLNAVLGIGKRGYIIDTRSQAAAKASQTKGGGYEPDAHYSHWRRIHQSIEKRQTFHESLIKLLEACTDDGCSMDKWLSKLESSNWLTHVKDVLTCACTVAQCIDSEGANVLVHGSEGFDSTLQITSLVQVVLDHDCRTINGFEALVEREWLQAGHPFNDRCVKSAFAVTKNRQESPVFLLFLDCVWQIWQQFPCSFEFNEDFLVALITHAYYSDFGTFLCNNEKERKKFKLSERTVSLWTYLTRPEILEQYLNPMYDPNPHVIWPSVAPQSLGVWTSLYQRSYIKDAKKKEAWREIDKIQSRDKELRSRVAKLRRMLASLEKEALSSGVMMPTDLEEDCTLEGGT
ncbi:myotubularin-related protein 9-like isoform X2 [Ostrea edulis]|uniref:myotubularin-related protein 9-like isoform X2 n=1 Tax=Ostrea edulis TaxID=37623 RepID=UPI00209517C4|nr:myotubularin-related protein 9-like isoform X2 [Ostrea edulis]XP_055995804.1 myotubularin-related protein 9-like isoform X2 [Ostrea edulis]